MKDDSTNKTDNATTEVVIPDECGDTMWDAVLQQEVKVCDVNVNSKNVASLINGMNAAKDGKSFTG